MRETAWVVFAGRAFIQPQARFTLPGESLYNTEYNDFKNIK